MPTPKLWADTTKRTRRSFGVSRAESLGRMLHGLADFWAAKDHPLSEYRGDFLRFGKEVLGHTYWSGQEAILRAVSQHPRVSVRGCRNWGKTFSASDAVLAMGSTSPSNIIVFAPSHKQLRYRMWAEIRTAHAGARVKLPGVCNTLDWQIGPDWSAFGISTDDPSNVRGFHAGVDPLEAVRGVAARTKPPRQLFFVFDEANAIAQPIYDAIKGALAGPNVHVLMLANPTCAADEQIEFARSQQPGSGYHRIWVSAEPVERDEVGAEESFHEVPRWLMDPKWIEEMRRDYGEKHPLYLSDVRGQFASGATEWVIVTRQHLEVAADLPLADDGKPESRHIGVDVAREGGDRCVASLWIGGALSAVHSWRTKADPSSLMTTAATVIQLLKRWGPAGKQVPDRNVHVDATGLGGGVADRLHQCGYAVDRVDFGSGAKYDWPALNGQTVFQSRKAELFWTLRRALEEGQASIPAKYRDVWKQLIWHRYKITPGARGSVIGMRESKEELVKLHGESPDFADSAVFAWSRSGAVKPTFRVLGD